MKITNRLQYLRVLILLLVVFGAYCLLVLILQAVFWQIFAFYQSTHDFIHNFLVLLAYPLALLVLISLIGKKKFTQTIQYYPQSKPGPKLPKPLNDNNQTLVSKIDPIIVLLMVYAIIPVCLGLLLYEMTIWMQQIVPPDDYYKSLRAFKHFRTNPLLIWELVFYILFTSATESLVFQGFLQGSLRALPRNKKHTRLIYWSFLAGIQLLFALSFMNIWQSVPMFFIGLFLAWARNATHSMFAIIWIRATSILFLFILENRLLNLEILYREGIEAIQSPLAIWIVGLALIQILYSIYFIFKKSRLQKTL